jgi:hypothetical protein
VQKPKNFLAFSLRLLPPPLRREAEKYGKEFFGFASPFHFTFAHKFGMI